MGMDVYGNKPSDECGKYFRSSVWSWAVICHLCATQGDTDTEDWGTNDGDGLESHEECELLASRLAQFLDDWKWDDDSFRPFEVDLDFCVDEEGNLLSRRSAKARVAKGVPVLSPYAVSREILTEFVEFLRHCGGFQIW